VNEAEVVDVQAAAPEDDFEEDIVEEEDDEEVLIDLEDLEVGDELEVVETDNTNVQSQTGNWDTDF